MNRLTNNALIKCQDCFESSNCYNHSCNHINEAIQKLAYYEDLEDGGFLKIAPIKDGTKIFYIDDRDFMDFEKMVFDDSYLFGFTEYRHGEFNKDWFLTRDEAELKLKEVNNVIS